MWNKVFLVRLSRVIFYSRNNIWFIDKQYYKKFGWRLDYENTEFT